MTWRGRRVEIGWRFLRAAWGQGFATEAARPVLDHALGTLGLAEVVADIDPANMASVRVAAKLGLRAGGGVPYAGRLVTRYVARPGGAPVGGGQAAAHRS